MGMDVTEPGKKKKNGKRHVIKRSIEEIETYFQNFGFEIIYGPEVETQFFNFDAVNVPKNHPARDMQDTFFLKNSNNVLRTHTSSVQARYMLKNKLPIRIISSGRVFRNERTDATHEVEFHQVECLMIGENISMANLKGILVEFFRNFFEDVSLELRIRPSYFPFVEPGIEVDITCCRCKKKIKINCALCKGSGFIEVGGAGMVHRNVLKGGEVDSKKFQGFAFGLGVERMVMLKYGVSDIRKFYDGNLFFLKQF